MHDLVSHATMHENKDRGKQTQCLLRLKENKDSPKKQMAQQDSVADFFKGFVPARLCAARLSKRTVIAVEGEDALSFVDDLTTNGIARIAGKSSDKRSDKRVEGEAQATAFLTAQGTLQQFCLAVRTPHGLWLECDRARLDVFAESLWKARLGRAVSFRWLKEMQVVGLFPETTDSPTASPKTMPGKNLGKILGLQDEGKDTAGCLFADPREPLAAMRLWHKEAEAMLQTTALPTLSWVEEKDYESYRLALGVVERAEEWEGAARASQKHAFPFAFGLDALGAMDWQKDCYVGQEIAARLKYRARVPKKHALPVRLSGGAGAGKADVCAGDKVFVETEEGIERLCGEVLYAVVSEGQTILFVLFGLASLRLGLKGAEKNLIVLCASGKRLEGEILLPSWLGGQFYERALQATHDGK